MKITPEMLKARGACESQYNLFVELFPDGVEVTEELCVKHAGDFNFGWASLNLLNSSQLGTYYEARAQLQKAYYEAAVPHRKAFSDGGASLWTAYAEIAQLWKTYEGANAREFFRASQL